MDASKRVFLHVGSPKTGSTFLQEVLWSQRAAAEEQGLRLPLTSFFDHFLATVDVRDLAGQERFPERAAGIWELVVQDGLRWPGNVLVSHELLAAATAEQAAHAVQAWGDTDVHIILTARDLARQIPAEWQEHLKHRAAITFTDFIEALKARSREAEWFWLVQDFADVCRRWGGTVPPQNVHVVTVPPRGAPPELLWDRFASLVGLDPHSFDLTLSRANASLKAEQAELLRRVNDRLGERLPMPGSYPGTVKEVFAQMVLQGRPGLTIALDPENTAYAVKRSLELVAELEELGVDVVGDLAELVPAEASAPSENETQHPETIPDASLLAESIEATSALLTRVSDDLEKAATTQRRLQRDLEHTRGELNELRERHERFVRDMLHRPFHHFVVGVSETHPGVMRLRVKYWHVVERLRRVARRRPSG
jgi:hypothetical protein